MKPGDLAELSDGWASGTMWGNDGGPVCFIYKNDVLLVLAVQIDGNFIEHLVLKENRIGWIVGNDIQLLKNTRSGQ